MLIDVGIITPSDTTDATTELNCNCIIVKDNAVQNVTLILRGNESETPVTISLGADQGPSGGGWFYGDIKYVLATGTTVSPNNLLYGYDRRQPGREGTGTHASNHPLTPNAKKKFGYINVND